MEKDALRLELDAGRLREKKIFKEEINELKMRLSLEKRNGRKRSREEDIEDGDEFEEGRDRGGGRGSERGGEGGSERGGIRSFEAVFLTGRTGNNNIENIENNNNQNQDEVEEGWTNGNNKSNSNSYEELNTLVNTEEHSSYSQEHSVYSQEDSSSSHCQH